MTRRFRVSRRSFLRGAGATSIAIGLPFLDAMRPSGPARAVAVPRLVTFFVPNGLPLEHTIPSAVGAGYAFPASLGALGGLEAAVNVVTGVRGVGGPDSHAAGICAFATGVSGTTLGAGSASIDQIAALARDAAPVVVACEPEARGSDSNGHAAQCFVNASWVARETPAAAERTPTAVFRRLFGAAPAPDAPEEGLSSATRATYRRSVLDFVRGDVERLAVRLGAEDAWRLDAHLTAIRELERRVDATRTVECAVPAAPDDMDNIDWPPRGHTARAQLMAEILAMGLVCNATDVASFMYANGGGWGGWDEDRGLSGSQHEHAHAGLRDLMLDYSRVHVEVFAAFVRALAAAPEDGGSVLDNSLVVMGTELGDGEHHTAEDLPFVVAGGACGALVTGRHIPTEGAPLDRFLVTMLRAVGVSANVGSASEPISAIL